MYCSTVDVLCIAETKLDDSVLEGQIILSGFGKPCRLGKTSISGDLLTYVKNKIPSKRLTSFSLPNDIQIIPIEINLRKYKWLVVSIYRPPKQKLLYKYFI